MTFNDKVKCSDIVATSYIRKGNAYKPPKKRVISIIFALILALYTILMCYLGYEKHKTQYAEFVDAFYLFMLIAPVFLAIIKVVFSIIFAFIKNSIYSINHEQLYKFLHMLSDVDMLLILVFNIFNYYFFAGHDVNLYWDKSASFFTNIGNLLSKDNRDLFAFLLTIIINLPIVFHAIGFTFRNGGILYLSIFISPIWPIFFFKYLHNTRKDFYEYKSYNEDYYEVNYRMINKKHYKFGVNLTKFTFCALILMGGLILGNFINIHISYVDFYNRIAGMGVGYCIAGALINYAYFFDLRLSMAIDEKAKKFYISLDTLYAEQARKTIEARKQQQALSK
ncbi:MAG: hypothetical protein IJU60_07090 [Acholeplasmatales bacterium]|nr:hypothetical protein [Acholeplasmatales bacterium]